MDKVSVVSRLDNDAVVLAFCAALMFIIMYSVVARWWKSAIGIALVTLDAGIALVIGPAILHYLAGIPVGSLPFMWYEFASILIVAFAIIWRTILLVRDQVNGKQPEHRGDVQDEV